MEASVFGGALGYAHRVSGSTLLGLELGAGVPQIDVTLHPRSSPRYGSVDLEEYLHLAAFARFRPGARFDLDAGIRAGVADLYECTASDCWPAGFVGAYVQPMVGWSRWKVGARLVLALVGESEEGGSESSSIALGVAPLLVRVTLPW